VRLVLGRDATEDEIRDPRALLHRLDDEPEQPKRTFRERVSTLSITTVAEYRREDAA